MKLGSQQSIICNVCTQSHLPMRSRKLCVQLTPDKQIDIMIFHIAASPNIFKKLIEENTLFR